jgi:hypothetical protein
MHTSAAACPRANVTCHRSIVFCLLLVLALFSTVIPAAAQRGRPTITRDPGAGLSATYYTFVSDAGTLLRGSRWSTDIRTPQGICNLPARSSITNLRALGFNALHLYGETWTQGYGAGACQSAIDQLVDWTGQDGLYLVLTIGNANAGGTYNASFAVAFWTNYAPRYAGRTHVLYEIQNEPYYSAGNSQPSPAGLIGFERDMYNLIRAAAPATPVLFFSYPVFRDANGVITDVNALQAQIPSLTWSNEAIAFHGYAPTLAETENTLLAVLGRNSATGWNGAPCVQTEYFNASTNGQDVPQTIVLEDHFTSWLTFVDVNAVANDALYKTPLDSSGVVWAADFGAWPATSAPPRGRTVSFFNRRYVSALNSTTPLTASATRARVTEKYTVVDSGDGRWVGLWAQSVGQDVCADNAGSTPLIANRSAVGFWEEFEWMTRPDGTVVLRARANNKIVSADRNRTNPPQLIANQKVAGAWELFTVTLY